MKSRPYKTTVTKLLKQCSTARKVFLNWEKRNKNHSKTRKI